MLSMLPLIHPPSKKNPHGYRQTDQSIASITRAERKRRDKKRKEAYRAKMRNKK